MSRRRYQLVVPIVALLLVALACQFSFSSAKIENARLASDPEGASPTTSFGQEDTFYLLGELENAPSDTKLKAVWTAVEAEGLSPNSLLDEAEVQGSDGPFTFSLEKSQPIWPVGSYKVDLYLNDELNQAFEFQVERTVLPSVENLRLSRDDAGAQLTESFGQEDVFFLLGDLANSPAPATLKAVWTGLDLDGSGSEQVIGERELQATTGAFSFSLTSQQPTWTAGRYKVDLFLDGDNVFSREFVVEPTAQAEIQNARLARDSQGAEPTTSFAPSDTFHLLADLVNAPAGGLPVKTVWTAVQVEGAESQEIDTVIDTIENGPIVGTLTSTSGAWPLGQYRVELYLNETLAQSLDFEVTESGAPSGSTGAPGLTGLYLAKDDNGDVVTSVFLPQESVYLHGELVNAPQGGQLQANWIAADVEGYAPNEQISEPETFDATEGGFSINLIKVQGKDWTPGEYKVDVLLNGEQVETLTFLISNTRIENAFMAFDQDGNRKTEVFGTQDPFFLLFDLVDAPDDTVVRTTWFQLETDTTEETQINDSEYTFGTGSYYVRLTSDSGLWEPGEYEVALYLDGYYYTSLFFSVQ